MTEIHDCERVIRRITADMEPKRDSERRVIIDVKHRRAVDRGVLLYFWREYKYFIVSNSDDPNNEASGIISLPYKNGTGTAPVDIDISYKAWCLPGKEKQVGTALSYGNDPGEVLSGLISKLAVEHIGSQNGSFQISNFDSKSLLEKTIINKVQMDVGLDLEIELSFKLPWPIRISDSFPVRAKDYDKEETVTLSLELDVAPAAESNVIQYTEKTLKEFIRAEIQSYFAYNVSLQQIYFKLPDDDFRYLLIRQLNQLLQSRDLRVSFLAIEQLRQSAPPPEFFKTRVHTTYELDEPGSPVMIRSNVLMSLQNVARYLASGSPDLTQWVESHLQRHVQHELAGAQYADLVIDFQPFAENIERHMRPEALAIGYHLEHFKSLPDLEPYTWVEGIDIETEDVDEEFETSLPRFSVKLSFSLVVRVRDLRSIRTFLERQQDVPALMRKALLDTTRQVLSETHPRRFYTQFSRIHAPGGFAFEDALRARFADILGQRFDAEIIEALFEIGDTETTRTLETLRSENGEFTVVIPTNLRNAEECRLRGYFKVDQVADEGWETFRLTVPTIARIKEHLEAGIKTALENHPTALVAFKDTFNLDEIQQVVKQAGQCAVLKAFGLQISVSGIGSDAIESEKKIAAAITNVQTESIEIGVTRYFLIAKLISEKIRELEFQMVTTKAAGGPQNIIEDIQKRIEALKAHSPTAPIIPELSYETLRDTQKAKKPV
ncbi:MAG: hypothetical protein ACJ74J_02765 [Blastocatellia bacterium]